MIKPRLALGGETRFKRITRPRVHFVQIENLQQTKRQHKLTSKAV
jgi:hypothetical protein